MGIARLEGRDFTDLDTRDTGRVAIVNETFATRHLGGRPAVGRRITTWRRPFTVVGVVADSKYHALDEAAQPYFYVPLKQLFVADTGVALHVRTRTDATAVAAVVRDAMRGVDPSVPNDLMTTMGEYISAAWYTQQIAATLLTALASPALLVAAMGLYSLMAYGVARRRREFGVRVALGATARDIRRLVIGRGLALVVSGLVVGVAATLLGVRLLSSLLFGVSPFDAVALVAAAALLVAIGTCASYVPARAATRVDPIAALRAE